MALDLNLLPVSRATGRDEPELLGLFGMDAPRRTGRGRTGERLVLYFSMSGTAVLPPGKRDQMLADLGRLYFETPGSVTSAMRAVAEELNRLLLERNQRLASSNRQGWGLLGQLVVKESQLYLALSGPVHAYLVNASGVQHFHEPEEIERGLGQAKTAAVHYQTTTLQPADTLLLAANPSPEWSTESLRRLYGQGPESLRRRLFAQPEVDLNAVIIQARQGKGGIFIRPLATLSDTAVHPAPAPAAQPDVAPAAPGAPQEGVESPPLPWEEAQPAEMLPLAASLDAPPPDQENALGPEPPLIQEVGAAAPDTAPQATRRERRRAAMGAGVAGLGAALAGAARRFTQALRTLFIRILPEDTFLTLPSSVMAFVAVATPFTVVAVTGWIYFSVGRDAQYEILYGQAQQLAQQAATQEDLQAQRDAWGAVQGLAQQAQRYRNSPEARSLEEQATLALDRLDLVVRVAYQPAIIGGLPPEALITQMVISDRDLYLLDSASGNVIRAEPTSQGYEVDLTFQCGLQAPGVTLNGSLIDIVAWPAGYDPNTIFPEESSAPRITEHPTIVGLDNEGNFIYCEPGVPPSVMTLPPPSNSGAWGQLKAFTNELDDFFLLDPPASAVYVYWGHSILEPPNLFFNADIPVMTDAIDLAVNRDELYLLHDDGRLTLCIYSAFAVAPTRCSTPPYSDSRPGKENIPMAPASPFSHILTAPPPDPSLYFLEPANKAIYQYSLRNIVFQRQYLPSTSLGSQSATAFTLDSMRRILFLALGSQVFYAFQP